jgi:lysophospholipase L1-like esterase
MSSQRSKAFACLARAGVASAVFSAVVAARALPTEPAHNVAPLPIAAAHPARPNTATPNPVQPTACSASAQYADLDRPLLHTARRLAGGEPLTSVAIGSSSTAGAGASSPDASYPSRLEVELKKRFPASDITVLNRGVNGEETADMMARFEKDVFAAHPQLVLWQVGTNSVLRNRPLQEHAEQMRQGIDQLKASGADVVLIDLQYSPKVIEASETPDMVDQIAAASKEKNVDLFHRFAQMRDWREAQHLPFEAFVTPDGLHMNDWGYACWAKILSGAIAEAATRPVASAAAHARPSH